jgi:hypothetical protein
VSDGIASWLRPWPGGRLGPSGLGLADLGAASVSTQRPWRAAASHHKTGKPVAPSKNNHAKSQRHGGADASARPG